MSELKKLLKKRNNRAMLVIFIIGIVIILLSSVTREKDGNVNSTASGDMREEERLSEILSEIEGAGEVSVMITYERGEEEHSIGRGIGYDASEVYSKPRGVVIVADGADSPTVRLNLKEAAVAVTGVGANRVCVYDRDGRK